MKGGARVRSGPPADPNAIRRERDHLEWVTLPGERTTDAPAWPLSPAATSREKLLWAQEWRRPQSHAWETAGLQVEVAIYVRTLRAAEKPGATSALLAELRRQRDALGLTAAGMKSLRWRIGTTLPDVPRGNDDELEATGTDAPVARSWKVIDGHG